MDLKQRFRDEIRPQIKEALGLKNPMQVPTLVKVVVNIGVKATELDILKDLVQDLGKIVGQKPVVIKSTKNISNFKLREGMAVGAKVTLRGSRMFDFLDRLIKAALPRIRDFRGLPPAGFDGRGNYNFGIGDQLIFPEIDPDAVKHTHGMNITIVTTARSDDHAYELLSRLGMPLMKRN